MDTHRPSNQEIQKKLNDMDMQDFENLLKEVTDAGCKRRKEKHTHSELVSHLAQCRKAQAAEPIQNLTDAKYSSSLDHSLDQQSKNGKGDQNANPVVPSNSVLVNSNSQDKGHYHHQNYHRNHTSTLTTINSTSSLNSVGVDSAGAGGGDDRSSRNNNNPTSNLNGGSPDDKYLYNDQSSTSPLDIPLSNPVYFFNERDPDVLNGYHRRSNHSPSRSSYNNRRTPPPSCDFNNSVELSEGYPSVSCLTNEGSSTRSLNSAPRPHFDTTRSLTPNYSSSDKGMIIPNSPPEGHINDRLSRRGNMDRVSKKKGPKTAPRETEVRVDEMDGYIGNKSVTEILLTHFKDEDLSAGKKHKKREQRAKDKDTLKKSASLDENHLNYSDTKGASDTPSTTRPSKELGKKSSHSSPNRENLVSQITSSQSQGINEIELSKRSESFPRKKEDEKEKIIKDESSEGPFEVVNYNKKKKKQQTTTPTTRQSRTQGDAETFSQRIKPDKHRRDTKRTRRLKGDRRKSVGYDSESDDSSVRSLPVGSTAKEKVRGQKSASSEGTPQTSYADIARVSESNKASSPNNFPLVGGLAPPTRDGGQESDSSVKTATSPVVQQTKAKTVKPKAVTTNATVGQQEKEDSSQNIVSKEDCKVQRPEEENSGATRNKANQHLKSPVVPNPQQSAKASGPSANVPRSSNGIRGGSHNNHPPSARTGIPELNSSSAGEASISSNIKGEENKVHNSNGQGVKVPIEDKTEFPDISASLPSKPPFSERSNRKINSTSNNNNDTSKLDTNNIQGKENPSKGPSAPVEVSNKNISSAEAVKQQDAFTTEIISESAKTDELSSINIGQSSSSTPAVGNVSGEDNKTTSSSEGGSSRKKSKDSVPNKSHTPTDTPVVFWGNNFSKELPGNLGFQFGLGVDVIETMSKGNAEPQTQESNLKDEEPESVKTTASTPTASSVEKEEGQIESRRSVNPSVPDRSNNSASKDKTRRTSDPKVGILGVHPDSKNMSMSNSNRRNSQPHFSGGPRHPRGPSNFRGNQRNGGNVVQYRSPHSHQHPLMQQQQQQQMQQQQHAHQQLQQQPHYGMHMQGPQNPGTMPPQVVQQQQGIYPPTHMGPPGQNFTSMPSPYALPPGPPMSRGSAPSGHPTQQFMIPPHVMYVPHSQGYVADLPQISSEQGMGPGAPVLNAGPASTNMAIPPPFQQHPVAPVDMGYVALGGNISYPYVNGDIMYALYRHPLSVSVTAPIPPNWEEGQTYMQQQATRIYARAERGDIRILHLGDEEEDEDNKE